MSGNSVAHWWIQRITAVAMLPLPFICMLLLLSPSLEQGLVDVTTGWRGVLCLLFLLPAYYHGFLGLQIIIEDYVHNITLRAFLITFCKMLTFLTAGAMAVVVALRAVA